MPVGSWPRWSFVVLGALVLSAGLAPGESGSRLDDLEERLAQMRKQIEAGRRRIAELRQEGQDLDAVLKELGRQRDLLASYLRELAAKERALEGEIAREETLLEQRQVRLGYLRRDFSGLLRQFQKHRAAEVAELLFSSSNFAELFARLQYWARTVKAVRNRADSLRGALEATRRVISKLRERKKRLARTRAERRARLDELEVISAERRRQRECLEAEIAAFEDQVRRMEEASLRLQQLIAEEQARAHPLLPAEGLTGRRGRLPWPVSGRVITGFGTHIHPRYGTRVQFEGIEIAAPMGEPVLAVAPGEVVYSGWFEGYGRTVILAHGGGFYTVYGHCSSLSVRKGERVEERQEIARVGDTDSIKGSCLYFELRRGREALDPRRWLRH